MCVISLLREWKQKLIPYYIKQFHDPSFVSKRSLRSKRFHLASEQRKTGFGRARNEMRAKKWKRGKGEGKEGNACRQTPRFWKPAFASERSAWLARLLEQYSHVSIECLMSYFEKIAHMSVVWVYLSLWLCIFVALYVGMFVARAIIVWFPEVVGLKERPFS